MKKYIYIILALSLSAMQSCVDNQFTVRPSSRVTTFTTNTDAFNELEVEDAFEVFLTFSDTEESIEVEANDNLHDYIRIDNYDGRLEIRLDRSLNIRGNATLRVFITTREVHIYDLSGASRLQLENTCKADNLEIRLSGASSFDGNIEGRVAKFDFSGASSAELGGSLQVLDAELSGASTLSDYDLEVDQLYMVLSGASSAAISVNNLIELNASGASTLKYRGEAVIQSLELSGASNIKKE